MIRDADVTGGGGRGRLLLRRPVEGAGTVALRVARDRRRRLSDGALLEASLAARLFGLRILTIKATVAVVPVEVTAATPAVGGRAAPALPRPARAPRASPVAPGHRLADAVRHLDEGAELLAQAQRNGS